MAVSVSLRTGRVMMDARSEDAGHTDEEGPPGGHDDAANHLGGRLLREAQRDTHVNGRIGARDGRRDVDQVFFAEPHGRGPAAKRRAAEGAGESAAPERVGDDAAARAHDEHVGRVLALGRHEEPHRKVIARRQHAALLAGACRECLGERPFDDERRRRAAREHERAEVDDDARAPPAESPSSRTGDRRTRGTAREAGVVRLVGHTRGDYSYLPPFRAVRRTSRS